MTYISWFDPGESTGYVMGWFSPTHHYEPRTARQIEGGIPPLLEFLDEAFDPATGRQRGFVEGDLTGCEKFIPRPTEGHSPTLSSTLPLPIEGVLIGRGIMPPYPFGNWQASGAMVLRKGKDQAESLRLSNGLLAEKGLLLEGADVGCADANDANSATKHILAHLCRTLRHKPTIEWLYGEEI